MGLHVNKFLFPALRSRACALILALILINGLEQYLAYRIGLISGHFYNVLGKRSKPGFIEATWQSLILISGMTVTKSVRVFSSKLLAIFANDITV